MRKLTANTTDLVSNYAGLIKAISTSVLAATRPTLVLLPVNAIARSPVATATPVNRARLPTENGHCETTNAKPEPSTYKFCLACRRFEVHRSHPKPF